MANSHLASDKQEWDACVDMLSVDILAEDSITGDNLTGPLPVDPLPVLEAELQQSADDQADHADLTMEIHDQHHPALSVILVSLGYSILVPFIWTRDDKQELMDKAILLINTGVWFSSVLCNSSAQWDCKTATSMVGNMLVWTLNHVWIGLQFFQQAQGFPEIIMLGILSMAHSVLVLIKQSPTAEFASHKPSLRRTLLATMIQLILIVLLVTKNHKK